MNHHKSHFKFDDLPDDALVRLNYLIERGIIPFSPSTLWRKCRNGDFPSPIKVSPQVTAWRAGCVRSWLANPSNFKAMHAADNKGD